MSFVRVHSRKPTMVVENSKQNATTPMTVALWSSYALGGSCGAAEGSMADCEA